MDSNKLTDYRTELLRSQQVLSRRLGVLVNVGHHVYKFCREKIWITSWAVRAYGIYARVSDVSEIERVSEMNE